MNSFHNFFNGGGGGESINYLPQWGGQSVTNVRQFPWSMPKIPVGMETAGDVGSVSGDFSILNQYDAAFKAAGAAYGIDPNYVKAVAMEERGWEGTSVAGALGIMQIMPGGYSELEAKYPSWKTDPTQNIMLGAAILSAKRAEQGGDLDRGIMAYLGLGGADAYGTTPDQYLAGVKGYYRQLQQTTTPTAGGSGVGVGIVATAEKYLGTPYVWGSAPGKGAYPTSWDCSGFTYWLDQNYGDGNLPQGSHQQFQQAVAQNRLFLDLSQLQPGDLIYFYTEDDPGYTDHASHVAIYIGNNQIIHAANPDAGTIISNLSDSYYSTRFIGAEHMNWG